MFFRNFTLISFFLFVPFNLFAQNQANFPSARISGVKVEGNSSVGAEDILLQTKLKPGDIITQQKLSDDIKSIYRTGFFEKVSAELDQKNYSNTLMFIVTEKPHIRNVSFEGNDSFDDKELEEVTGFNERRFFTLPKIKQNIKNIKDFYQEKGYGEVEVEYKFEEADNNVVDLSFKIDEGSKTYVREIKFEGANAFKSKELKSEISTSVYNFFTSWLTGSAIASEGRLEADTRALSRFYLNRGYANVQIGKPQINKIDKGQSIVFQISEGDLFKIGKISASGDFIGKDQSDILEGIEVQSGDLFSIDDLRESTFHITRKYTDIGYAFANVSPNTSVQPQDKVVNLDYKIDSGDIVHISRINLSGNKKTRENVVRRSLEIHEGELYSSSKIQRSQTLLQRLGYFEEVGITNAPSGEKDKVDLDVQVREGQTGTFSLGAGVSSGDGVIFSSRVTERNLLGTGNSLSLNLNTGSSRENYTLSFNNPRVNDGHWSAGFDLLSVSREFDDFDRTQTGGSITVGYPLWFLGPEYLEDVRFSLRYEALSIEIDEVDEEAAILIQEEAGKTTSSSITPRIVRNTINNPLDPTEGSRQAISMEFAGLGGKEDFWLLELSNTFYYPYLETGLGEFVFANRTRFGWGQSYSGEDDRLPLFRRFFAGGINSVRGFDARELGPQDEEGSEFGGNKELVSSFELIFPVLKDAGLKFVAFYDIGQAFEEDVDIEFSDLRQAVGWGIRWRSPLAPIRIEIGYPLDKEEGDDSVVTHFSFGAPF